MANENKTNNGSKKPINENYSSNGTKTPVYKKPAPLPPIKPAKDKNSK